LKLALYIAKRYLLAKKSRNAINIISGVSVAGVTIGTMALFIVLSVFNGLETLVNSIFNTVDPELKIIPAEGKTFEPDSLKLLQLSSVEGIECYSLTLEENALLKYGERQFIGTLKGVDDNFVCVSAIDSSMWDGEFKLRSENGREWAVPGVGVANYLGIRINFINPLIIYIPDRQSGFTVDPSEAFKRQYIFPSGIFQVEQQWDDSYVFVPLGFARNLIGDNKAVSFIEIKTKPEASLEKVRKEVSELFGPGVIIKDRYEQQELFYKVMKSERLAIFFILTLIIFIASFNIIGSLTMLIIEKKRDVEILRSLGADNSLIKRIFIFEGWLISISGTIAGMITGLIICWLQQTYGLVKFSSEAMLMDSYPVVIKLSDIFIVPAVVLFIGYMAAWYPVRYLSIKYLRNKDDNN